MKLRKIYAVIVGIVLLVILFVGGFLAYEFISSRKDSADGVANSTSAKLQYEAPQDPNDPPITPFRALNAKILMPPPSTASAQEKKEYIAFVSKYASKTNTTTFKGCQPDPIVIWVKMGSEITLKNEDDQDHTVKMNKKVITKLPKNSTKKIKADFGKGAGIYTYECDDSNGSVGMFILSSK